MSQTRTVKLKKTLPGGKQETIVVTLDENNQVVPTKAPKEPQVSVEEYNRAAGVTIKVGPDGKRMITGISQEASRIMDFFNPSKPCWFPDCHRLRMDYDREIRQASCCQGAVHRKYFMLAKSAIEKQTRS